MSDGQLVLFDNVVGRRERKGKHQGHEWTGKELASL